MRFEQVVGRGAIAGLLLLVGVARADETKIDVKDVPKPVVDAVKAKFPKAEVTEAAKETEDGKTTYELAIKDGGKSIDVSATPEGKIVAIETTIEPKELPAKVSAAIASKYPKGTMKKAEEIIEIANGKETKSFEVILTTEAKKDVEVKVSPEGKILSEEESED
jgi:hypothetical protein